MISTSRLIFGKRYDIHALVKNEKCLVQEFINDCQESDQKKIIALLKRAADNGPPKNEEKFKSIKNTNLWEFKSYQVRILCAFEKDRIIIMSHGFIKKSQKMPKREIDKAINLFKEYSQGRLWE